MAANPHLATAMRENRALMRRMVAWLAQEAGVRQFLDIGTGLPTSPNVHQIAQAAAPEARAVNVDNDRCRSGCTHAHRTDRTRVTPSLHRPLSLRLVRVCVVSAGTGTGRKFLNRGYGVHPFEQFCHILPPSGNPIKGWIR
jgi:hypothetical protein